MTNEHHQTRARFTVGLTLAGVLAGGIWLAPGVLAVEEAPVADWQAVELQPLAEGHTTVVTDVDDDGVSVGSSGGKPVRWDEDGVVTALTLPEGCASGLATSIDGNGVAAGYVDCGSTELKGATWTAANAVTTLQDPLYIADRTDGGIAVGQRDPESGTNDTAFAFANGTRLDLPDFGAASSSANAVTEYGFVVGDVEGVSSLPSSVAVGWFGNKSFPLVRQNVATHAVDVTESAYALVQISEEGGKRAVVVEPKKGALIELSSAGKDDVVVDINEAGIVVGTRTTTGESPKQVGGYYTVTGSFLELQALATAEETAQFGFEAPAALNDGAWVVGNHDGGSWLLRPADEPTTTTTAAPTTSTVAPTSSTVPETTSTTEAPTTSTTEPEAPTTTVAPDPEDEEETPSTTVPEAPTTTAPEAAPVD